jgi:signal transduction histidine kinase
MKRYNFDFREIHALINAYKNRFCDSSNMILNAFDEEKSIIVNDYKTQLNQIPIENLKTKTELEAGLINIEKLTSEFKNSISERFESFIKHVESLNFDIDDDYLVGWYKEQNENIEKKLQETNELAQLGMSIEIIDHQFNVMYSHISDSLDYFKRYVKEHNELEYQFEQMNTAFQHLENNHRLLYPLYRTSRRSRTVITGKNITDYLLKFFEAIFSKNNIQLSSDESFYNYEYFTFESIIKPVFINVINNAVYWLTSSHERKIRLTTKNNKVLILNNGEKIEDKILEDIFTLFFSRKRDGRGIGLYLARTNLRSIGFDIIASNDKEYNLLKGACFIIEPIEN